MKNPASVFKVAAAAVCFVAILDLASCEFLETMFPKLREERIESENFRRTAFEIELNLIDKQTGESIDPEGVYACLLLKEGVSVSDVQIASELYYGAVVFYAGDADLPDDSEMKEITRNGFADGKLDFSSRWTRVCCFETRLFEIPFSSYLDRIWEEPYGDYEDKKNRHSELSSEISKYLKGCALGKWDLVQGYFDKCYLKVSDSTGKYEEWTCSSLRQVAKKDSRYNGKVWEKSIEGTRLHIDIELDRKE